jgi:hypothetical protein
METVVSNAYMIKKCSFGILWFFEILCYQTRPYCFLLMYASIFWWKNMKTSLKAH